MPLRIAWRQDLSAKTSAPTGRPRRHLASRTGRARVSPGEALQEESAPGTLSPCTQLVPSGIDAGRLQNEVCPLQIGADLLHGRSAPLQARPYQEKIQSATFRIQSAPWQNQSALVQIDAAQGQKDADLGTDGSAACTGESALGQIESFLGTADVAAWQIDVATGQIDGATCTDGLFPRTDGSARVRGQGG
jgi:hypothetical protein